MDSLVGIQRLRKTFEKSLRDGDAEMIFACIETVNREYPELVDDWTHQAQPVLREVQKEYLEQIAEWKHPDERKHQSDYRLI